MERSDITSDAAPTRPDELASLSDHDIALRFESLGGTGHGGEFGMFQRHYGAEPLGLLRWADTPVDLLIKALENQFEGVGAPENTILFAPEDGAEWWTRDRRFWMATRTFVSTAYVQREQMISMACRRLRFLSRKMIEDLRAAEKIFVYRNLHRNLSATERDRLYRALRSYGQGTLFCLQYADADNPSGTVQRADEGVLVAYVDCFGYAASGRPTAPSEALFLELCRKALALMGAGSQGAPRPEAAAPAAVAPEAAAPAAVAPAASAPAAVAPAPLAAAVVSPTVVSPVTAAIPAIPGTTVSPAAARPALPSPATLSRRERTIVMIGNCQVAAMKALYARFVVPRTGENVHYLPNYEELRAGGRELVDAADVIVEQILDMKPAVDLAGGAAGAKRVYVPNVTAGFLWPFAGSPHPKNEPHEFLNNAGPYGSEYSDSFLNRMILEEVDPEEAVETYLALDVRQRVNLDRMHELMMDRQRARDAASGFSIADIIEQHFRTEPVFLTPYHPNTRVAVALASQLFTQLGADLADIERMRQCTRTSPFPKDELPIHPGVGRHFGLTFVKPDRRYRYLDEGLFTAREFALRYMRYEWNRPLAEGMYLLHKGRLAEAREKLAAGLRQSPSSAAGHHAMRHILTHANESDAALASARLAAAIEPNAPTYRASLGGQLHAVGRTAEAEAELRAAVALDPSDQHAQGLLAHVLRSAGRDAEALVHLKQAAEADPFSEALREQIAQVSAAIAARNAASPAPSQDEVAGQARLRVAQDLARANKLDEAIEAVTEAVRLLPRHHGARLLRSQLLLRVNRAEDATLDALCAVLLDPTQGPGYLHLGNLLRRNGEPEAAEEAYRKAAALMPGNAHVLHEMSLLYRQEKRFADSAAAARRAAELEPTLARRHEHLAVMLMDGRDYAAAHEALTRASELAPGSLVARIYRSELFGREDRLDEASAEIGAVVADEPRNIHALMQMAQILQLRGAWDEAEQTLRRALDIEPHNGGLRHRLAALQAQRERSRAA